MTKTQVHKCGTSIIIDRENNKVIYEYPNKSVEYDLNEEWIQKYTNCAFCNEPLNDSDFAWALWKFQKECCSSNCVVKDFNKRYACCDKAVPTPCVCIASFNCPIHGQTHIGTHD